MAAFDKIGDQSIKDLLLGLQQLLREAEAIGHGFIDRFNVRVKVFDKEVVSVELPPWSPKT